MKKQWKKTLEELKSEIPEDIFDSLLHVSLPRSVQQQSVIQLSLDSKAILARIRPELKRKIERRLQSQLDSRLKLQWSSTAPTRKFIRSWLHPEYTMDRFMGSSSNRMAMLASDAVCLQPGKSNPFVLIGRPGNGKTHLIHGLVHTIDSMQSGLNVYYTTYRDLQDEISQQLAQKTILEFKKSIKKKCTC